MRLRVSWFGVIWLLVTTSSAYGQTAKRALLVTQPHWYSQFQLGSHDFEVVVPLARPFLLGNAPSRLTIGYFFTSRWAVEVGYTFGYFFNERNLIGTTIDSLPTSTYYYSKSWSHTFPLLVRRRLTKNLNHRVRFDGMAGLTILTYWDEFKNREVVNGQEMWYHEFSNHTVNAYFILGSAMSFRLSRHLDLELNGTLNKNLQSIDRNYSRQALNSTLGFQRGWSLGLRYNFLLHKTPVATK